MKEKRYFLDKRIGIIAVIDGNISKRRNCMHDYPKGAVKFKSNLIWNKKTKQWYIHWYTPIVCFFYVTFLNIFSKKKSPSNDRKNIVR